MDYPGRIKHLQEDLDVDALYVSNLTNVRYLCGFTGSSGSLLVAPHAAWFLTDGRYRIQAAGEVVGAEVEVYGLPDQQGATLSRIAGELRARQVGFESDHVSVASAERLKGSFPGCELVGTTELVEALRRVKEPEELDRIREAARLADEGFSYILGQVRPGVSERELAILLESHMRFEGAEAVSFPSIVAAAERSALPHAHPSNREVEAGRFLLFDLGCVVDGYCSDITRTVVIGRADDRHREVYDLVAAAQQAGLDALAPGRTGAEVDKAARDVIAAAGHGEEFGHSLGHGVGLDIHETPVLRSTSADILEAGHVVTVEPGVYIAGWGGVRIEDLTVVTEAGHETLSRSPKELIVL